MKTENIVKDKSYMFALRIVRAYQYLSQEKHEYVISDQMLRSGTAIGAAICMAEYGYSKVDFIHNLKIASKEANETEYWLMLLRDCDYIDINVFNSIYADCVELIKLLTSIINTTKKSIINC